MKETWRKLQFACTEVVACCLSVFPAASALIVSAKCPIELSMVPSKQYTCNCFNL